MRFINTSRFTNDRDSSGVPGLNQCRHGNRLVQNGITCKINAITIEYLYWCILICIRLKLRTRSPRFECAQIFLLSITSKNARCWAIIFLMPQIILDMTFVLKSQGPNVFLFLLSVSTALCVQLLASNRDIFVTEQSILQYFGMIRNNMDAIRSEKHKGTPRELKLFYQVRMSW